MTCFWDVLQRAPDPSLSTYMPGRNDLVTIFAEMGYRPEELYREGVTPPLLNLPDAYRRLAAHPDLVQRIARITSAGPCPPRPLARTPHRYDSSARRPCIACSTHCRKSGA